MKVSMFHLMPHRELPDAVLDQSRRLHEEIAREVRAALHPIG